MSVRRTLGRLLISCVMEIGALSGAVTPEEIEKLMSTMHRTKIVRIEPNEEPEEPGPAEERRPRGGP
jgi:hypothetical protein